MKECLRKSLQKETNMEKYTQEQRLQSSFNFITVCYGLNALIMWSMMSVVYTFYPLNDTSQINFILSLAFYLGASIFESLWEPKIIYILDKTEYEKKVKVEGTSLFIRGGILFGLLYFDMGILAFGLAHWTYTFVMLILLTLQTDSKPNALIMFNLESIPLFSFKEIKLEKSSVYFLDVHKTQLAQMSLIGAFRFLLTEGENLVLNFTSNLTLAQQGEYSLISNLWSIIWRFIFQPLEELSYSVFGKESLKDTHIDYMSKLIRNLWFIGLLIVSFSQNFAYSALYVLYKEQWTNDSTVAILQAYGIYIFTMGINGITEAFVMARSDKPQLQTMQKTMTISSVIFVAAMFMFVKIGPTGIVYANIMNMLARIITNMSIIKKICIKDEFSHLIRHSLPKLHTIACVMLTFGVWLWAKSKYEQQNMILYLGIGAVNGALCLAVNFLL